MNAELRRYLDGPVDERLCRYAATSGRTVSEAGRFLVSVALEAEPLPSALTFPLARLSPWPTGLLAPYSAIQFYGASAPVRSLRVEATEGALVDYGMRLCVNERALDPELLLGAERAKRIEKAKRGR